MIRSVEFRNDLLGHQEAWCNSIRPCQPIDVACKALDQRRSYTFRNKAIESAARWLNGCQILFCIFTAIVISTFHSCCSRRGLLPSKTLLSLGAMVLTN